MRYLTLAPDAVIRFDKACVLLVTAGEGTFHNEASNVSVKVGDQITVPDTAGCSVSASESKTLCLLVIELTERETAP